VADTPPEPIAPFALRLVRSTEMIAHIEELLGSVPIEWLHTAVRSITRRDDGLYEVGTDTGIHVEADRPVFDAATATLFDPLDERSFAYLLPLSPVEALLESASFGPVALEEDQTPLLRYLRARHPEAGFQVTHAESGAIPLVFAPPKTTGPRHIPLGTKRGLIKPSAGYGIVRIAEQSKRLARLWRDNRPLPPSWRSSWHWRLLDKGFLQLAARDPRPPLALLDRVMGTIPLAQSLAFIDEELPLGQLAPLLRSSSPVVFR